MDLRAPNDSVICGRLKNSESLCKLDGLLSHLPASQRAELLVGQEISIAHDIDVGVCPPIKQRFYCCAVKIY